MSYFGSEYNCNIDWKTIYLALQTGDIIKLLPILLDYNLLLLIKTDKLTINSFPRIVSVINQHNCFGISYVGSLCKFKFYETRTLIKYSSEVATITSIKHSKLTIEQCLNILTPMTKRYPDLIKIIRIVLGCLPLSNSCQLINYPA